MLLLIAVAGVLWILYTKPQQVPGRRYLTSESSVIATPTASVAGAAAGPAGMAAAEPTATAAGASAGPPAADGQGDAEAGVARPRSEASAADDAEAGE
jgi:hypothetical protein